MTPANFCVCVLAVFVCFTSLVLSVSASSSFDCIIPPWVDSFTGIPRINLRVSFSGANVEHSRLFSHNQTFVRPRVTLSGHDLRPQDAYTFIIVDPDAYNPATHVARSVIHYIISNIPGSTSPSQDVTEIGRTVLDYLHPGKPTFLAPGPYGVHRYYTLLFKQERITENVHNVTLRSNFSVRNFTSTYKLGYPVAGLMFRVNIDA